MIGQKVKCVACKTEFTGLASEAYCPNCREDQRLYATTRRKGEPRDFLPYPTLLEAWRKRRDECRDWRKLVEEANAAIAKARVIERENEALRMTPEYSQDAEKLCLLVAELRTQVAHQQEFITTLRAEVLVKVRRNFLDTGSPAIPADRIKQLRSLCHPDRWQDQPQQRTATEVMQWLNSETPR